VKIRIETGKASNTYFSCNLSQKRERCNKNKIPVQEKSKRYSQKDNEKIPEKIPYVNHKGKQHSLVHNQSGAPHVRVFHLRDDQSHCLFNLGTERPGKRSLYSSPCVSLYSACHFTPAELCCDLLLRMEVSHGKP
jgi:hypothetical protein